MLLEMKKTLALSFSGVYECISKIKIKYVCISTRIHVKFAICDMNSQQVATKTQTRAAKVSTLRQQHDEL